jgi:hypothetical protein
VDRERLTATAVLGEMRIRAILTPVEGLLHKNPTKSIVAEEPDPMAAARKAEEARLRRDATATPVVRLVWIGGGSKDMNAMQLVNVYMHVSAIIST